MKNNKKIIELKPEHNYKEGQKINVPREMRPMLQEVIARREQYETEAFRTIGEAFGYGAKDIHHDQTWLFAIDMVKEVAFCFLKGDEKMERIKEVPIPKVMNGVIMLEAAKPSNHIVVTSIEKLMPAMMHYHWTLHPETMEIEIKSKKQPPRVSPTQPGTVQ